MVSWCLTSHPLGDTFMHHKYTSFKRQQNSLVNLSLRRNLDDVPKRDTRDSTVLSWGIRVTSQSTVFSHVGGASWPKITEAPVKIHVPRPSLSISGVGSRNQYFISGCTVIVFWNILCENNCHEGGKNWFKYDGKKKSLVFLLLDLGNCLLIFKNTFCCYYQGGTKTGFHQRMESAINWGCLDLGCYNKVLATRWLKQPTFPTVLKSSQSMTEKLVYPIPSENPLPSLWGYIFLFLDGRERGIISLFL